MRNLKRKIKSLKKDCLLAKQIEYKLDKSILTSMTGGVFWGKNDEAWPLFNSKPLIPILSILTSELPFRTPHFDNIELINVFAYEEGAPIDEKEGSVVIRTYTDLKELKPLEMPDELMKPCFKLNWRKVVDYPNGYQLELNLDEGEYRKYLDNNSYLMDEFPNHHGIKIGGWPYLVQETYFLQMDEPDFAFQFDSNEVFMFCDSGLGYFLINDKNGWHSHWDTM
ncbi:DUF1963 domain-containing protein [Carboxylicivirga sp. A043]|uniref:YwqG family protein n=1 Tax=Carboxylicivirga litoralis TaxID=2816963 RepID=UPI0021CB931B|nr:YwqG family protein [Carboxylicivirga sp. A043]MCU4156585.1 DUF1963 domain-containing protein [Carboxylicivirga sp. A043]